ncbi:unnamed protein product, partial [Brachionus calyciflorus]
RIDMKFTAPSNLNGHLKKHKLLRKWFEIYSEFTARGRPQYEIGSKEILLVKYFLTSNTAVTHLQNKFLRSLLKIKLPHPNTFTKVIIPNVKSNIENRLQNLLKDAFSVCSIVDLWSSPSNSQFLALGASIVMENFSKSIRIIGMGKMPGTSTAEAIKTVIEELINRFEFDKTKICGFVSDGASSLIRLFQQNENSLFVEQIETVEQIENDFLNDKNSSNNQENNNENDEDILLNQTVYHNDLHKRFNEVDEEINRISQSNYPAVNIAELNEDDEVDYEDEIPENDSLEYDNREDRRRDSQRPCTSQQASSVSSENSALMSFIDSRPYQSSDDITRITLNEKIQNEKKNFLNLLHDETNVKKTTFSFWTLYESKLPILSKVFKKIFSISASSASIERFFSICGLYKHFIYDDGCHLDETVQANIDKHLVQKDMVFFIDRFQLKIIQEKYTRKNIIPF